ncbi:nucleotidyltransferase family protein [Candidatus Micrarchaeota archaeon]|nr:nucleotidyltransferase family protein [Candidatus Micrarchaeota archaeon]
MRSRPDIRQMVAFLTKNGAKKISIFGSCARGEMKKGSDIDVLISFKETKSLFELVRLEQEASKIAGKKVDLVTESSVSPLILPYIKKEAKVYHS